MMYNRYHKYEVNRVLEILKVGKFGVSHFVRLSVIA